MDLFFKTLFLRIFISLGVIKEQILEMIKNHKENRLNRSFGEETPELWEVATTMAGRKPTFRFERKAASLVEAEWQSISDNGKGSKTLLIGSVISAHTIKEHDEILICVPTDSSESLKTVPFTKSLGWGEDKNFMLKNHTRSPLWTAKCFNYKKARTIIINSAEFKERYGYDAESSYNGQVFMKGLDLDLIKAFINVVNPRLYSQAIQLRAMPILTDDVIENDKGFVVKGLLTNFEDAFFYDVVEFLESYDIELGEKDLVGFCSEVKIGDGATRVVESSVVGFSNIPCVAKSMSYGAQTRVHLTGTQHAFALADIGSDVIDGNINGCFGVFDKAMTSRVNLGAGNEMEKLACGDVFPESCFETPLENGGHTRSAYYEKVVNHIQGISRYDARHLGAMAYMVGTRVLLNGEMVAPIEVAKRLRSRLAKAKHLGADRSPSLLPIGIKTMPKDSELAEMFHKHTWEEFADFDEQAIPWEEIEGMSYLQVINIEGFLFNKQNLVVLNNDWAEKTLMGDFDGDMARVFPVASERKGCQKKYDPVTIKKPDLICTVDNALKVLKECRESSKAIGVCAAVISSCIETSKRLENQGKIAPNILDEQFLRLCSMVNGFVDMTKYDIEPVTLFGIEIKDLEGFEKAAWMFMHPREDEFPGWADEGGEAYRIGRKNYQQLFTGNPKQLWIDSKIDLETECLIDQGFDKDVAREMARVELEKRYNNLKTRDNKDIVDSWRFKLDEELQEDYIHASHTYGHTVDRLNDAIMKHPGYHEPFSHEDLAKLIGDKADELLASRLDTLTKGAAKARKKGKVVMVAPSVQLEQERARARELVQFTSELYYKITDTNTGKADGIDVLRRDAEAKRFVFKSLDNVINGESFAVRRMMMLSAVSSELKHAKYSKSLPFSYALCTGNFWSWIFDSVNSKEESIEI
jgi:hypothetical protein